MPPYVRQKLPSADFAWCESQLREAQLTPYVSRRTTTEWFHLDSPPELAVDGSISFQGERFPFRWRLVSGVAELEVNLVGHSRKSELALLDQLIAIFPDTEPPQVVRPPFRDRVAETLAPPVGCLFVLFVIAAVLFLAGYGVVALLRGH